MRFKDYLSDADTPVVLSPIDSLMDVTCMCLSSQTQVMRNVVCTYVTQLLMGEAFSAAPPAGWEYNDGKPYNRSTNAYADYHGKRSRLLA